MSKELQNQLATLLANLTDFGKTAAQWTWEQVPPLVHEKIMFGRATTTTCVVISFILITIALTTIPRLLKIKSAYKRDDEFWCWFWLGGIVPAVFGLVTFSENIYDFFLVWFAPRLYIVEWLMELAKPVRK